MSTIRTFTGKRMSEAVYNKAFGKALQSSVKGKYNLCYADWTEARFQFNSGVDPQSAAAFVATRRNNQIASAETVRCRIWRDEFEHTVELRGAPNSLSDQIIREAFDRGETEGAFLAWVDDARFSSDIHPVLVSWQSL